MGVTIADETLSLQLGKVSTDTTPKVQMICP